MLGHELTHAVTERTAGLVYEGQSGALNESLSDVFGSCLKQRLLGQDAVEGDWLIGEGLFLPGVQGRALRDMAHPGTAYDDPVLGKDPQPDHMDDYVDTTDDNGGVHLNSGIPNRAFQLAAVAVGGSAAEGAGRIWYAALTGGLPPRSRLRRLRGRPPSPRPASTRTRSSEAWRDRRRHPGDDATAGPGQPPPATAGDRTGARPAYRRLRRAGRRRRGRPRRRRPPRPRAGPAGRPDRPARGGRWQPQPDMYVYAFDLCGDRATVPEQHLTSDLRRVADLVLDRRRRDSP